MKILLVFGTRPEAIKLAPVYKRLVEKVGGEHVKICVTAQHRQMLDQVLGLFNISPDFDLDLMEPGQTLERLTSRVIIGVSEVLINWKPDIVLVQGDTTSCFASAIAAFYQRIPVAHVEAGLRTGNLMAPWPEEMNRKLTAGIATLHFAPTLEAKNNLLKENISEATIFVTGNTVVDALLLVVDKIHSQSGMLLGLKAQFSFLDPEKKIVLVTGHRRENFGGGFERICQAILQIAADNDVEVVYPVHLNPNIKTVASSMLGGFKNIHLIEPLEYLPFVYLMNSAYLILTDSGGVQEEAPSLGKPVLVLRDTTERPEGVAAGIVQLVGTSSKKILAAANKLLKCDEYYKTVAKIHNPYGDGNASQRISNIILGENYSEFFIP